MAVTWLPVRWTRVSVFGTLPNSLISTARGDESTVASKVQRVDVLLVSTEDMLDPDGRYVAAGSLDKSVRVWDTTTGYLVERLENPDGPQRRTVLSPLPEAMNRPLPAKSKE
jgi:WD40 repeat protein